MEKLNELVELAKKATPGRNYDRLDSCGGGIKYQCLGEDGSLVLQCDHKNNEYGFIGPKAAEDEAFFLACKPETIFAIDEVFRELEQRVEAAEAKLAELEKQEAIFQVEVSGNHWLNAGPVEDSDFTGLPDGINLLYARPAPAVDLNAVRAEAIEDAAKQLYGQGYNFEVLSRFAALLGHRQRG